MKFLGKLRGLVIFTLAIVGLIRIGTLAAPPDIMPVISRNCPVFVSDGLGSQANDNNYRTAWRGTVPGWIAYDLSKIPVGQRSKIILVWYNPMTYDHTVKNAGASNNLKAYTIEAHPAAGANTAPTSGWVTLATVIGNTDHSRQHLLNFTGYNWIRLNIAKSDGSGGNAGAGINLDIHSAVQDETDDWIFYGDSITAGGRSVYYHQKH